MLVVSMGSHAKSKIFKHCDNAAKNEDLAAPSFPVVKRQYGADEPGCEGTKGRGGCRG